MAHSAQDSITITGSDGTEVKTTGAQLHQMAAGLKLGIKISEIKAACPELEAACNRKIGAAEAFADLCKLVALKSGIDASVLSTYITAVCNETLAKKEKQSEQLALLFEEMA